LGSAGAMSHLSYSLANISRQPSARVRPVVFGYALPNRALNLIPAKEMTIESLSAKLSEIVLPDFDERPMRLGSLWESQNGWVFCREHVAQLLEHEPKIKARGANLAAIGMGDFHYARLFREETGILFPLLVDVQRGACRAAELKCANLLHLLRRANAAARKRANAEGHRQNKFGVLCALSS